MKNKNNKLAIGIAILFEIISIVTAILNLVSKQWYVVMLMLTIIISLLLPFIITYIASKKILMLPSSFQLIFVLFILLAQYLGEYLTFYTVFWWWDLFLHGFFGGYTVVIALHLIQGVIISKEEVTKKRFIIFSAIFAFCFSVALGTLWEIFEFLSDYFFKTQMTAGSLEDTATDLIIKSSLALITASFYCYHKLRTSNNS